ncbi:sensor domain-containing protein [Thauera linaloolentis]|uniref:Diguanylate cyclase/phosphodiesterase n=1 Tax=Thauera linaloolentis (strain DSM 12138 / JCM 21573 / CCUG 41526 / CIP 105981 / IAM 15112 / NBRC 102519 / 47Lol) TaxID=1123367 RepID=N6Z844_THAL4|nr:GGDEF and EAL domain-containing protein [Thauera linaloolentis]ENO88314.1 diguanylate cyclase/phosphodiesterase [Thauera linaloolentis 47Lol = DSM 12138]MCM8564476.1 EAL domain-containing protein [Thauera linaloolentis]
MPMPEETTLPAGAHAMAPSTQLAALGRVMAMAEFAPDGTLTHANDNYLGLLGLTREQAVGSHHSRFCRKSFVDDEAYQAFWSRLLHGDACSGLAERVRQDDSSCWLEATYVPVIDAQGRVRQILKVATDVTERLRQEQDQQEHLLRLSLVADASHAAVIISDAASAIVYVNAGFSRLLGWRQDEAIGASPILLLAPHQEAAFIEAYRAELRAGRSIEREEIVIGKDGQRYWAKVISNPVMDAGGRWQYTVTMLTDITSSKLHQVLQHRALDAMAREQPLSEVLDIICQEVERIAPELTASILEVDEQGRLHPLASPSLPAHYTEALDGVEIGPRAGSCGTAAWRNEAVWVQDIAHDPLWDGYRDLVLSLGFTGCWSTPIRNSRGEVIGTFAFYLRQAASPSSAHFHQRLVDACTHLCTLALEREHSRQRIRELAFYDGLTGMPNRSLLYARADQEIATCSRLHKSMAVLFIDLDRFKQVNDSLGHPAGDELLRHVAAHLQQQLRGTDFAGRLSGDEFVILLPGCSADEAAGAVERIQHVLAGPVSIAGTTVSVSASIGIAMFPSDGRDIETLLHRADMAMYQAKSCGRNESRFFSSEMNQLAQERLRLENALREALQDNQLHLHYQPQIDLASGRLYGVEALARWTHPEFGVIPPVRFIPLAEECGLIGDLGRWVLREACRQLAAWRAAGLSVPAVSVNLSPTSFHNLDLPGMISDTLARNALDSADLTVELTESVLLDTHPSTMKTLTEVHARGVRLSMDDFGTGYSSLSYLRRLPVSELKLDRSFVADLEHDEAARALSGAILGIGKSLHLTVVAEGVETPTQNEMLREQGYPVAQGYLFSQPLPPDEFARWLGTAVEDGAPG